MSVPRALSQSLINSKRTRDYSFFHQIIDKRLTILHEKFFFHYPCDLFTDKTPSTAFYLPETPSVSGWKHRNDFPPLQPRDFRTRRSPTYNSRVKCSNTDLIPTPRRRGKRKKTRATSYFSNYLFLDRFSGQQPGGNYHEIIQ